MKTVLLFATIIGTAIFTSPISSAATGEENLCQIFREKADTLRSDLNLSPDQKAKIRSLLKDHREPIRAQWKKGREARETMRRATLDHGPESTQVKTAADSIAIVARDRSLLIAKIATEIRPILTAEQLQKFEKARVDFESLIDSKLQSAD